MSFYEVEINYLTVLVFLYFILKTIKVNESTKIMELQITTGNKEFEIP